MQHVNSSKESYTKPKINISQFDMDDVILTSGCQGQVGCPSDYDSLCSPDDDLG